jgi:hypothetical protein
VGFSRYSTNKTDRYDITEMLLKVTLNTIKPTPERRDYDVAKMGFKTGAGKKQNQFVFDGSF